MKTLAAAIRASNGRAVSIANDKMPGSTFGTDPTACHTGSKLRQVPGSICAKCYAIRLAAMRPSVAQGWRKSEATLRAMAVADAETRARFVAAMAFQITWQCAKTDAYNRWFDSGDLPSVEVLELLLEIIHATPKIRHWIPTREVGIVRAWAKKRGATLATLRRIVPRNAVIRVSDTMIDQKRDTGSPWSSGVVTSGATCHAYRTQRDGVVISLDEYKVIKKAKQLSKADLGHCGDCRKCWNRKISYVTYPLH